MRLIRLRWFVLSLISIACEVLSRVTFLNFDCNETRLFFEESLACRDSPFSFGWTWLGILALLE